MQAAKFQPGDIIVKTLIWGFLILVCIYCLIPFAWMLSTSLKTEAEAFRMPPTWIPLEPTVDSYIGIWVRKKFGIYFFNRLFLALWQAMGFPGFFSRAGGF
jgi:ABC-type glycerol-3-phosphate transport system permease component